MRILLDKFKEVFLAVFPITLLVLILAFTITPMPAELLLRFLIGAVFIIFGLGVFLWGTELGITPIGEGASKFISRFRHPLLLGILGFLIGFFITVAEPDLLILSQQIENATGGVMKAPLIVIIVSVGVGILVDIGLFRMLMNGSIRLLFTIGYVLCFALAFLVPDVYIAMGFDASGATTGAITTPFILAIGLGVSALKGSSKGESESFGLVGTMSMGPILAVLAGGLIMGSAGEGTASVTTASGHGILLPFLHALPHTAVESLKTISPILVFFFLMNIIHLHLPKRELVRILKGIFYLLFGLTFFLTGVNNGFMEVGFVLGEELSEGMKLLLPLIGFLLGFLVVLAEPAVHVLGNQVEEVTGGSIPKKLILICLSIGVSMAVMISMIRIQVPSFHLLHILLPGFLIAILLSYKVDPLFVGIAFDAGGVASGPMAATFLLAVTQGAASKIPTANLLLDGFGIIATVAMTPVLSILILGAVYQAKKRKEQRT